MGPTQSCGPQRDCPVVADTCTCVRCKCLGYRGDDWLQHWLDDYRTQVLTPPENERHSARVWFSSLRQAIETAFSHLCDNFGLHFPQAHTTWGLLARIAAKVAAYNVGIVINRLCGRHDLHGVCQTRMAVRPEEGPSAPNARRTPVQTGPRKCA